LAAKPSIGMLTSMGTARADIRRWIASRRAAEARELAEAASVPADPLGSFRRAQSLIALARRRHGWPLPVDPAAAAEDERGWERWARLRRRLARP
jgi:hypothetical protein